MKVRNENENVRSRSSRDWRRQIASGDTRLKIRSASAVSLGLNMMQKRCGLLYSPGGASQPSNTPSPTARSNKPGCALKAQVEHDWRRRRGEKGATFCDSADTAT